MTSIEWTEETWNPIVGCSIVTSGCAHCYAMRGARRMTAIPHYAGTITKVNGKTVWTGRVNLAEHKLIEPLAWKRPRMVFVNSMGDLFHEAAPDEWIDSVFGVMARCPQHTFQILTKRPERMQRYMSKHGALRGVWLGVSAERQQEADERIPILLQTPAAGRFVSCEPLLGPIDLTAMLAGLGWVIVGGESGKGARPMDRQWARDILDQCAAAGVPFFMKQMFGPVKARMPPIPDDLLVREWPSRA